jgi:hypothetical protein
MDSIDEVLAALDEVVETATERRDPVGYFAAVYRKVTAKVAEGIDVGFFDDAERMTRLDVVFAGRYLSALRAWQAGDHPTKSWEIAFEAARGANLLVLQHLLLGINAHINLDLGVAAAQTAPGESLVDLRRDFDRINEILASLLAEIRRDLHSVSPWIGLLDRLGGRGDDEVIRFSMQAARTSAWRFAVELAPLHADHWSGPIAVRDGRVAALARTVLAPGPLRGWLWLIRARESSDVRRNIQTLRAVPAPALAVVEARVRAERAPDR